MRGVTKNIEKGVIIMPQPASSKSSMIKSSQLWKAITERAAFTWIQSLGAGLAVLSLPVVENLGVVPVTILVATSAALNSFVTSMGKVAVGAGGPGITERLKDKLVAQDHYPDAGDGSTTDHQVNVTKK